MARIQILELPEGAGGDRAPFVLVVDETSYPTAEAHHAAETWWRQFAGDIGAGGCLVTDDTLDIPANDTSAYLDADFRTSVESWTTGTNETIARLIDAINGKTKRHSANEGQRLADERTDIARDADRLANHKAALTDALSMDRLRDWDDVRNAARGLRKERDALAEAAQRVRDLHRAVEYRGAAICAECSAFGGSTTDNAPVAFDQCGTLRALSGNQPAPDA